MAACRANRGPHLTILSGEPASPASGCGKNPSKPWKARSEARSPAPGQDVALETGVCDGCRWRTRGVEHHFFRPFVIRMDPQIDPLMRGNFRPRRMDRSRKAPASDKQCYEKDTPQPRKVLA